MATNGTHFSKLELTPDTLAKFNGEFAKDDRNLMAQNFVCKSDPLEACLNRKVLEKTNHVFNHKVDEVKPLTNQKGSGRCWLFAALNAIRIPFMKENNIDDFEFSQAHLFFWDKVERCNYFLNTVVEIANRSPSERADGRLLSFLLESPSSDGGQWDMVVNLIQKHGLIPKKCFPETFSCESSMRMNGLLKTKLREFSFELHTMIDASASEQELQAKIHEQMEVIYRIISICLSAPPARFSWQYYDKSKKAKCIANITPMEFYNQHVKQHFDMDNKVCLVSDPRPQNPVGKSYTVDCLGNVIGGKPTVYNNQPIDVLMALSKEAIKSKVPVWFGCDVRKHMASRQGIMDLEVYQHKLVYGTDVNQVLNKANRMIYGQSQMTHAMLITGVHLDENDEPLKWRIENSWGEDRNEKGYFVMTNDWFREYVFEVVVDKSICSEEILKVFQTEPEVLPAWDPMGALAC